MVFPADARVHYQRDVRRGNVEAAVTVVREQVGSVGGRKMSIATNVLVVVLLSSALCAGSASGIARAGTPRGWQSAQVRLGDDRDIVAFNVSNNKYHDLGCLWAKRCTVNCIKITRKEAHARGGIPCKVCGGGE